MAICRGRSNKMGERSAIEWCDHTWNPWIGCTEVSPACDHCYARTLMADRYGRVQWGVGKNRIRTSVENWKLPFRWERAAASTGGNPFVFCLSLGDIWDNEVPEPWRYDAMDVIEQTPHLIYLLLSKRIGNAIKMTDPLRGCRMLPKNTALGATVINQEEWDRDVPKLLEAARILGPRFTFVSVEPMLGLIHMNGLLPGWVICGGESGPYRRLLDLSWARVLQTECWEEGVPFFMKQIDKVQPIPDDLMTREWPKSEVMI